MVVGHALQAVEQRVDGRFGLLRITGGAGRQVAFFGFAHGQIFAQRAAVALIELAQMLGRIAGTFDLVGRAGQVKHELAGHDADQHQHDQANAFLAVIRTVYKADRHGGNDQYQSVPERRVLLVIQLAALVRGLVHLRQWTPPFQGNQHQTRNDKAGQRREHQRSADIDRFLPVHAIGQRDIVEQGIGQTHTEYRADQRVRTGGRNTKVPSPEVPGNGRRQQREHHGQAVSGVDVDEQFDRQQMHDGIGNAHAAQQHAEKVEYTGEEHGQMRRHCFGVNDCRHRVGGVMKAVDELEGEDESQGEQQAHKHPGIKPAE